MKEKALIFLKHKLSCQDSNLQSNVLINKFSTFLGLCNFKAGHFDMLKTGRLKCYGCNNKLPIVDDGGKWIGRRKEDGCFMEREFVKSVYKMSNSYLPMVFQYIVMNHVKIISGKLGSTFCTAKMKFRDSTTTTKPKHQNKIKL